MNERETVATLPDIVERLRYWGDDDFRPLSPQSARDTYRKTMREAADEIERLRAFRNRIVGFFNELHEDAKDEHGCRIPYMLFGDDADVLERFEKVIGEDRNG